MNFIKFTNELKTKENKSLVEAIQSGYKALYENTDENGGEYFLVSADAYKAKIEFEVVKNDLIDIVDEDNLMSSLEAIGIYSDALSEAVDLATFNVHDYGFLIRGYFTQEIERLSEFGVEYGGDADYNDVMVSLLLNGKIVTEGMEFDDIPELLKSLASEIEDSALNYLDDRIWDDAVADTEILRGESRLDF